MNKEYLDIISSDTVKINGFILRCPQLAFKKDLPEDRVLEAENYALSVGGKRIRPVMAVEFYRLFSGCEEIPDYVYEAACVLEMTHTFSLIHDDMPEMDDDELRRGFPTRDRASVRRSFLGFRRFGRARLSA